MVNLTNSLLDNVKYRPHKSKYMNQLNNLKKRFFTRSAEIEIEWQLKEKSCRPWSWFDERTTEGLQLALLAPTAMTQQKLHFELRPNGEVKATPGKGFYTKLDLGIAKYHFEVASKMNIG